MNVMEEITKWGHEKVLFVNNEEAGLKGYTIGGAQVSEKHAGFIINVGQATASDVLALIDYIVSVIKENVGIELQPEVKYIKNPAD